MDNTLPLYDVQELSLEELVQLMVQQTRTAVNDGAPQDHLQLDEVGVMQQA